MPVICELTYTGFFMLKIENFRIYKYNKYNHFMLEFFSVCPSTTSKCRLPQLENKNITLSSVLYITVVDQTMFALR